MISNYFGYFALNNESRPKISNVNNNNFKSVLINDYADIYASTSNKNLYYGKFDNTFWIVAGIGLIYKKEKLRIAKKNEWEECIKENCFPDYGHYSLLIIKNKTLRLINDPTGTRTLYYYRTNIGIFFSTRISDISEQIGINLPDIANIGSLYILSSNLNNSTEIKNIQKLMYDEELIINSNGFYLKKYDKIKKLMRTNDKISLNHSLIDLFKSISENHILLALSGGFDSRYIMSILLKNNIHFQTFTFGCKNELDSSIAMEISNACNINHYLFDNYDKSGLVEKIEHYLSYNPFTLSIHRIPYLYNYESINFKNQFIIDGAFGEFYSKRFFVKWRLFSRFGMNNPRIIYNLIAKSLPMIFNMDIQMFAEEKAFNSFRNALEEFRENTYLNHPIDYIFFKYIYSNHWAREQSFMDKYIYSCIPFLQAPIIANFQKNTLSVSSKHIKANTNILSMYPLIKKNSNLPFSDVKRFLMKSLYPSKSNSYSTKDTCEFYRIPDIKEYIHNSINSSEFRNSSLLNQRYIIDSVNQFYIEENTNTISTLQTFLSFMATKRITH